ncbi:tail terminator [Microbacterium phage MortySmith]|nr:tail terminator [Microbacterium phage JDawG]WNM69098.1 tail terminator [Microbacterium phage Erudite]
MSEFVPPYQSIRDTIVAFLQSRPELHALGLAEEDSVFQADTTMSPEVRPFIVVRMGETEARLGGSAAQPADLWVYDDFGDYNRATKLAKAALSVMAEHLLDVPTADGRLSQVNDRGIGADLADDGFDALVIPGHFAAIGNGS